MTSSSLSRWSPRPWLTLLLLVVPLRIWAGSGDDPRVAAQAAPGTFAIASRGQVAPLWVAPGDAAAVRRAVRTFSEDVQRVTGHQPAVRELAQPERNALAIVVGTVGQSPLLERLVADGKIDLGELSGRWESFLHQVVEQPFPGVERALVIAGSDRRGTIYGVYDLSQQIGVSPWYWWADVPVRPAMELHHAAGRWVDPGPVVKYRGIFLNDEAPALSGWATEKFGGFNAAFYGHLFEVILRLRGNYLWPAMWGNAFNDDDPQNPVLADDYGIVVGTSHHEPLMRAHDEWRRYGEGAWNYTTNAERLREFWRGGLERVKDFEKIISVGMRGDGDEPMSEEANVALLERIVEDQRAIIGQVHGRPAAEVPQLWALYKEVQDYYEDGMRVPDDVTLLWADDNWGNIRRLPTPGERDRAGGAGVYYHFDYVGGPRNTKWINITPITKIWEQMHLAWQHEANRIWIVNVGDFKPMEFPTEFFLTYAWNPARWPYEKLGEYSRQVAARDFGAEHAAEIAALINGYSKLNRRRTPEMLEPTTLSLVHYREAERVLAEWQDLVTRATRLRSQLAPEFHDAYFQLVEYPVVASANVWQAYVAAGRNRWYTLQGRSAANTAAEQTLHHFRRDEALVEQYHGLRDGRWNHQMAQVKFGYTYWQQPNIEASPALQFVRPKRPADLALSIQGSDRSWPSYNAGPAVLPPLNPLRPETRWIDVFNRGQESFTFRAASDQPWVRLDPASGTVQEQTRMEVGVDWSRVPPDASAATITIEHVGGARHTVRLPLDRPPPAAPGTYVEVDRHIAIEAPLFSRAVSRGEVEWRVLADFGRTLGAVTAFPVTASEVTPGGDSPRLEYDLHLVSSGPVKLELHCAPSLDIQSGEGLRVAVSLNDEPPQVIRLDTWQTLATWEKAVGESVRKISAELVVPAPGPQVLKLWMVTPGVVIERIILDAGGVKPSYLGPPATPRA